MRYNHFSLDVDTIDLDHSVSSAFCESSPDTEEDQERLKTLWSTFKVITIWEKQFYFTIIIHWQIFTHSSKAHSRQCRKFCPQNWQIAKKCMEIHSTYIYLNFQGLVEVKGNTWALYCWSVHRRLFEVLALVETGKNREDIPFNYLSTNNCTKQVTKLQLKQIRESTVDWWASQGLQAEFFLEALKSSTSQLCR